MAADPNNVSSLIPRTGSETGLLLLPVRGEKRIVPVVYDSASSLGMNGSSVSIQPQDFAITAAMENFVEYVQVRLPGRGVNAQGLPASAPSAYFQFLIDPAQVSIQRQQLATQSMARAGWQIGVKGEDFITIVLEGRTPGRYFSNGLTDLLPDFSASFRNLTALELVVENNGYWFEGEQAGEGPLAVGFTRRSIKMHSDVELTVGEFLWSGMFETLDIRDDAENPYLSSFSITFVAWREHYRSETPYPNPIGGATTYGHSTIVAVADGNTSQGNSTTPVIPDTSILTATSSTAASASNVAATGIPPLPNYVAAQSAGLASITAQPSLPTFDVASTTQIVNPSSFPWNLQ